MKLLLEHWPKLLAIALIIGAYNYVNGLITDNAALQNAVESRDETIKNKDLAIQQAQANASDTEQELDRLLRQRDRDIQESIEINQAANEREQQLQNYIATLKQELINENGIDDCAFKPMPESVIRMLNGAGTQNSLSDKDSNQARKDTGRSDN